MNKSPLPARTLLAVFILATGSRVSGQTAVTPPALDDDNREETVVLSPFIVQAEEDTGYSAKATLAGTRIRTELKDVGSSISVVTQKFLQDTVSNRAEQVLVYTPNTEVSGQGGNFLGRGDGKYLTGISTDINQTTRVRGLTTADNTRDFFLTAIPWDSYNTGRVDLQRGPNSILFGIGSPAGIINASPNPAAFKNSHKVEVQFGSYGSQRYSADLNQVIIPKELAVRVALLQDDTKYRQDPAYRDDHRSYAAIKWDPGFLNKGSAHTSIRANYEKGNINANQPRNTPPLDALTGWFNYLNKQTYDPSSIMLGVRSSTPGLGGVGGSAGTTVAAWELFGPHGDQLGAFLGTHSDSTPGVYYLPVGVGTFDNFATRARFPGYTIDAWKARSITDRSIFDYFNHLLEGPNNHQFNDFDAFNVALSQTFFNDKLGIELAFDRQHVRSGGFNYFESAEAAALSVDIVTKVPFGASNPNVGRPMFVSHGGYGQWSDNVNKVWRATAFGDLDFAAISGKGSFMQRIFGRNTFTGLAQRQERNNLFANYKGYMADQPSFIGVGDTGTHHIPGGIYQDDLFFYNYLGGAITGNTASGLHLQGLQGAVIPHSTTINAWNYDKTLVDMIPLPVIDNVHTSDRDKRYGGGAKSWDRVDSTAIVWQGYWLDGSVVPMFGYRTDKQTFRNAGDPPSYGFSNRYRNIWASDWTLPDTGSTAKVRSKTYSVVTHLPENLRRRLPGHMDVSLIYNQSENIQPGAGRTDVYGDQVPDPTGKTKEYGVAISGLDDRVTLKVVHYETTVKNANVGDSISNQYQYMVFTDSWGQWGAFAWRDHPGDPAYFQSSVVYGHSSDGHAVTWLPDGPPKGHGMGQFDYSQAELDATWAKEKASLDAWFKPENQLPEAVVKHWGLTDYHSPNSTAFPAGTIPGGLQVTGDTTSKGYEIELIANPIKGLNVSFNASKTSAKRTDLAQSFVKFIESRWAVFQGPAGDMRYWATSDPVLGFLPGVDDRDDPKNGLAHGGDGWSARGQFKREVMSGYWLYRALENSDVPELKPWAFNVIADYAFQDERFRGLHIGGGYRWQDRNVIGFPVVSDANSPERYDVSRPYYGTTEGTLDLWVGYQRRLNKRLVWRTQFNVRNALANDHLIRVTNEPDGTPAAYRIPEPRTFVWSNALEF